MLYYLLLLYGSFTGIDTKGLCFRSSSRANSRVHCKLMYTRNQGLFLGVSELVCLVRQYPGAHLLRFAKLSIYIYLYIYRKLNAVPAAIP